MTRCFNVTLVVGEKGKTPGEPPFFDGFAYFSLGEPQFLGRFCCPFLIIPSFLNP